AAAAAAAVTTEAREQIAQIEVLEAARTEARFPVLRGLEVLTRPVAAQLVVGGPFLRIGKGLIGLRNFLESLFRVRFLRDVRMVFAGELAVGLLDLVLGRPALDAQGGVVILVFHGSAGEWDTTETCARRAVLSSRRRKPGRAARQKCKTPEVSGLGRRICRPPGPPGWPGRPSQDRV